MIQLLEYLGNEWLKVLHAIADRFSDQNSNWKRGQVLLKLKAAVHGQEHIELCACQSKQFAILDSGPSGLLNSQALVTKQKRSQASGKVLVKQDAHRLSGRCGPLQVLRLPVPGSR